MFNLYKCLMVLLLFLKRILITHYKENHLIKLVYYQKKTEGFLRSRSSDPRRSPLKNENWKSGSVMPWGLIRIVHTPRIFFPEMYSLAKNASPTFARLQIYTFFPTILKKSKFKNRPQSRPRDVFRVSITQKK